MAITDPRRLLPGDIWKTIFEIEPSCKCYVRGCYEPAVVGRIHKITGRVDSCRSHDPEKHAYGRAFGHPGAIEAARNQPHRETPQQEIDRLLVRVAELMGKNPDDGYAVKAPRKPQPIMPPSGAQARPF